MKASSSKSLPAAKLIAQLQARTSGLDPYAFGSGSDKATYGIHLALSAAADILAGNSSPDEQYRAIVGKLRSSLGLAKPEGVIDSIIERDSVFK